MPFFARPDLSNEQFKQLPESTLTLSGQTQIATISGLTLSDGAGGNVIITANEAPIRAGEVLTYDGAGKIKLMPSGAGGTSIYLSPPYKPTASISLGGVTQGFQLSGQTISCIIEKLLVPTLNPTLNDPQFSFNLSPSNTIYEVGCTLPTLSAVASYNVGSIVPLYPNSYNGYRTGQPTAYNYNVRLSPVTDTITPPLPVPAPPSPTTIYSRTTVLANNFTINPNANLITGWVSHLGGQQPKDDSGADYGSACPAANLPTPAASKTITGIYPYFWGTSATLPVAGQGLINTGTKVVLDSNNDVNIDFNVNTPSKYLWIAIPSTSTLKTRWAGSNSPTNTEPIPGSLFGSPTALNVNNPVGSPNVWNGISYRFYISNYATNTYVGGPTPYYTITFKNS